MSAVFYKKTFWNLSLKLICIPGLVGLGLVTLWSGCGKNPTANFAGTPAVEKSDSLVAVDPQRPLDTLRVATFNMSVGFPVSQLLFTDMEDTAVAFAALDTLYKRYKHGAPSQRIKLMADSIKALNLDVVGLQEVMTLSKNGILDNDFLLELIGNIKDAGGPTYQSYRNTLNDTLLEGKLGTEKISLAFQEGNALLIKPGFRILDSAQINFFTLFQIPIPKAPKSERCVNYVRMQSPKGIVWQIYNTHLEIFPDFANSQASELKKIILEKGQGRNAQLVLGDFNSDPGKNAHQVMVEGGFLDAFIGIPIADTAYATCCVATSSLWDPRAAFSYRRIDNIFARRIVKYQEVHTSLGAAAVTSPTDTIFASDHRMVWATVIGQ